MNSSEKGMNRRRAVKYIAEQVRKKRGDKNLRQVEKESGVSISTLSRVEREMCLPDLLTFNRLCMWMRIDAGKALRRMR